MYLFIICVFCDTILNMKLKVNPWRLIWRFLIALAIVFIASFLVLASVFFNITWDPFSIATKPWGLTQYMIIGAFLVLGIGAFLPSLFGYYQIEKRYFIMKRYFKEYLFDYDKIEFIDIEQSKKKDMVIFYSSTAKMKYLLADKEGKLLEALIKKCSNTLSVEEFRRKHPEEKY